MRWSPSSLLRVPGLRRAWVRARQRVLLRLRGLRQLDAHGSVDRTVAHNARSLGASDPRSERLFLSCMCLEDLQQARCLVVGCRTEEEVFLFRSYGVRDVTAIDLMSYSPLVELADMHALPFPDDHFDLVFCAYTLSYSETPRRAAAELARVTRPGGAVALAVEYSPWERRAEVQRELLGYTIVPDTKLETADDLLGLFAPQVGQVYVRYDAERKRHHDVSGYVPDPSPVSVVFSIRK